MTKVEDRESVKVVFKSGHTETYEMATDDFQRIVLEICNYPVMADSMYRFKFGVIDLLEVVSIEKLT